MPEVPPEVQKKKKISGKRKGIAAFYVPPSS